MNVFVKALKDKHGTKEYVFYEAGKFAKPIMILTEGYAERLLTELIDAMGQPDKEAGDEQDTED